MSTTNTSSDTVTFVVCDKIITCSRQMLIDKSKYFKAMLDGDFKEASQDRIVLEDIEPRTFGKFITYLNLGEIELGDFKDTARMLKLADMYGNDKLTKLTSIELGEMLCDRKSIKSNFLEYVNIWSQLFPYLSSIGMETNWNRATSMSGIKFDSVPDILLRNMNEYQMVNTLTNIYCEDEMDVIWYIDRWVKSNDENVNSLLNVMKKVVIERLSQDQLLKISEDINYRKCLLNMICKKRSMNVRMSYTTIGATIVTQIEIFNACRYDEIRLQLDRSSKHMVVPQITIKFNDNVSIYLEKCSGIVACINHDDVMNRVSNQSGRWTIAWSYGWKKTTILILC